MTQPTIAIVQEAPVFLNLEASIEKAIQHIHEAAQKGANIIAFAECWLPGYPAWLDFAPNAAIWDDLGAKTLFRLLAENSVTVGDQHLRHLQKASDETDCFIVMGTHEREGNTLYNTTFTFSPGAQAPLPHRKLVPTYTERLVWGRGDGSTLTVAKTPWGNLGSLICWEHWMPLARAAMHAKEEAFHIAQWPIVRDMHQVASRHYAFEGRCAVAAAGSILSKGQIISGYRSLGSNTPEVETLLMSMPGEEDTLVHNGGSAIIGANGDYIAPPLYGKAGTILGTVDMGAQLAECQTLDTAGHYSRPDIFELKVNTKAMSGVIFDEN